MLWYIRVLNNSEIFKLYFLLYEDISCYSIKQRNRFGKKTKYIVTNIITGEKQKTDSLIVKLRFHCL